jgi:glutathione S-transferase
MDSQSIDELVTLRARVRELEASIAAHFAKVHGPESITACEAVTRLGEYAAKLQEAEKERDAWKKIASDADEFRPLYEKAETRCTQQAEALRAAREALEAWLDDFNRDIASGNFVSEDRFEAANLTDKALAPAAPAPETKKEDSRG